MNPPARSRRTVVAAQIAHLGKSPRSSSQAILSSTETCLPPSSLAQARNSQVDPLTRPLENRNSTAHSKPLPSPRLVAMNVLASRAAGKPLEPRPATDRRFSSAARCKGSPFEGAM